MSRPKKTTPPAASSGGVAAAPPLPPAPPAATVTTVRLDELVADPGNLRTRDDRAKGALRSSIETFGPARSIVLDAGGTVRAGNGTIEAAAAAGVTEVLVVEPAPGQLVAVRRSDWSRAEARRYAVADNRLSELAGWDAIGLGSALREFQSSGDDLAAVGFTAGEVDGLLEGLGSSILDDSSGPDADAGDGHADGLAAGPRLGVVVECDDAAQQTELLERFRVEGLTCRLFTPSAGRRRGGGKTARG